MSNAIREDQKVLRCIERLPGAEKLAGEFRAAELGADPSGALQDEYRIAHHPVLVAPRLPDGAVMNPQLGQYVAGGELKIPEGEIPLRRLGILSRRRDGGDHGQQRDERGVLHCRRAIVARLPACVPRSPPLTRLRAGWRAPRTFRGASRFAAATRAGPALRHRPPSWWGP